MRPQDSPRLEWVGDFGEVWDPSHARGCRRRPERRLRQAGGDPVWLALCPQVSEGEGLWQAGGWGEEEEVQGPPLACRALSLLSTSLADPHGVSSVPRAVSCATGPARTQPAVSPTRPGHDEGPGLHPPRPKPGGASDRHTGRGLTGSPDTGPPGPGGSPGTGTAGGTWCWRPRS